MGVPIKNAYGMQPLWASNVCLRASANTPLTPPRAWFLKNKILWKENNTVINYVYPTEGSHDQMPSSSTVKVPE